MLVPLPALLKSHATGTGDGTRSKRQNHSWLLPKNSSFCLETHRKSTKWEICFFYEVSERNPGLPTRAFGPRRLVSRFFFLKIHESFPQKVKYYFFLEVHIVFFFLTVHFMFYFLESSFKSSICRRFILYFNFQKVNFVFHFLESWSCSLIFREFIWCFIF